LAADRTRFEAFEKLGEFVAAYSRLEKRREADERSYVLAFAVLLGLTIVVAVVVGTLLAGGVTRRVSELGLATRRVAGGDLSTRVHEDAQDEIGDLARAFNRMLREVENSRERIEYLSRLASWQEMARRLAHEIKNPLTPIQLAVQEVHQRLVSLSPDQQQLLDVALEIVETEVQTLRRLVGEFSDFARLPESHMEESDFVQFLQELQREQGLGGQERTAAGSSQDPTPQLEFQLPSGAAQVYLDRQMMRRALLNLLNNASQAARGRGRPALVKISLHRLQDYFELLVDDDGPGVPGALRSTVFEPYVTTKDDGTGLGLAIVKKIVIEHKGHIEMLESPSGGARVRILIPLAERTSALVLQPQADA
jgi:two-component system, NtrC family, nitrogen regulation sensor histidine kinase NtrY